MQNILPEKYRGWTITLKNEPNRCSGFSFTISDKSGKSQHVAMGGHTADDARIRAKEMIDNEIAFTEEC